MPGITAIESPSKHANIDTALQSACLNERYSCHTILDEDEVFLAHTGYDRYPIAVVEGDEYTAVLEGYLYGTDDVEREISTAVTYLSDGEHEKLRQWVANRDGDFVLLVRDRTEGRTWIINDVFGRLPTYRATFGGMTIVSRELKVIRDIARQLGQELQANRLAMSQLLLFRYALGTRTLFEGVEQLPPGSLLDVGTGDVTSLYEHRFDQRSNEGKNASQNARHLKKLFLESCKNRASVVDETVVALSGGLDSRAVIAGYDTVTDRVSAATSASEAQVKSDEVVAAEQVAKTLGAEWNFYTVTRDGRHLNDMLHFTQGMNNVWNANGFHFAEQVANDHAHHTAMLVTGDGGDKAMPDLTLTQSAASVDELVDILIDTRSYFPIERVAELTGVSEREIAASIRERVESYPETSLNAKHAHFLIRERGLNWLNHGEDRTRYHLWATTPFYSLPFFTEAMACPPKQKRRTGLYREFLRDLSPSAVEVDYADFGAPITSMEYRAKRYAYDWISKHPTLKDRILGLIRGDSGKTSGERDVVRVISETNQNVIESERAFSEEHLHRLLENDDAYSNGQLHHLLTLLCARARNDIELQTQDGTLQTSRTRRSSPLESTVTND